MTQIDRKTLQSALRLIARPLVRFCLRHALKIQELVECCKAAFVEIAREEIERSGQKVTDSRISIMTGLHRRDVTRIALGEPNLDNSGGLITKLVGKWQTDNRYRTSAGKPRILDIGSERSEFYQLVGSISKELNPATVIFELERVGAVRKTARGLELIMQSYIPKGDVQAGFKILADDQEDLTAAVEENLFDELEVPNMHMRTEYDRVRLEAIPELRKFLIDEGRAFHKRVREEISRHDQDLNPVPSYKGKGVRVVLGSFSRIDD